MAKKGQKFKKYTLEEKMIIIKEYEQGICSTNLSRKYGVSDNTIRTWYRAYKQGKVGATKIGRSKKEVGEIDYKGDFTLESNNFVKNYPTDFLLTAHRFMAETAKYYADKIDSYRG
jgi:transposase-like protein